MTPLEQAWEHYGGSFITTRATGKNKARCPLHEDKNASATVDIGEQKWVCHAACGYGDIYELIQLAEPGGLRFPEVKEIAERFGEMYSSTPKRSKKRPGRRKPTWVGE